MFHSDEPLISRSPPAVTDTTIPEQRRGASPYSTEGPSCRTTERLNGALGEKGQRLTVRACQASTFTPKAEIGFGLAPFRTSTVSWRLG